MCLMRNWFSRSNLRAKQVFIIGLVSLNVLTLLLMPFSHGETFYSLLHSDSDDTFMDFFNSIYDGCFANPYAERGTIYPPLAYVYYRFMSLFLPAGQTALEWRNGQAGLIVMLVVNALTMAALYRVFLPEKERISADSRRVVGLILFGTVPFWYAIERGNLILLTLVFVAYFLKHYQSENRIKRELALISLAVAAAFKIYPACFGILLLTDRQYKEAGRCILYGIILFFFPFFLFGGIESFFYMIVRVVLNGDFMMSRGWGYKVNVDNTIGFLSALLNSHEISSLLVKLVLLGCIGYTVVFSDKTWQKYMALCSVMIVFPGFSFTYTLVFLAIPIFAFLHEAEGRNVWSMIYSSLFVCMMAPFPFEIQTLYDLVPAGTYWPTELIWRLNVTTVISSVALLVMLLLLPVDIFIARIRNKKVPVNHLSNSEGDCYEAETC